jgi:integrase
MLTDAKVRGLVASPPTTRQEIADGVVKGLMLRVGPRGTPSWTLRYAISGKGGVSARGKTIASRKFYRISLGDYPAMSIRDARARATLILAQAARGEDPIAKLEEQATVRKGSIAELAEDFLNSHVRGKLRSARNAEWIVRDFIVPRLGEHAPQKVRRLDIVNMLDDIARHATPTAAIDTRKWLSIFFSWAIEKGHVELNPVHGVKPPLKTKSRERVLSIDEARAVWHAAATEPYPFGTLACLLMLTAARLREIAHAKKSWLDRRTACLEIPGEAYKTGDPTIIPLLPQAMALLDTAPRLDAGEYLISSNRGRRPVWTVTPEALARIRAGAEERLGRPIEHWTLHDLRRTAATHMARLGVDEIVVERVLGHRIGGVKAVYNRYRYIDEKRAALALWAKELLGDD